MNEISPLSREIVVIWENISLEKRNPGRVGVRSRLARKIFSLVNLFYI